MRNFSVLFLIFVIIQIVASATPVKDYGIMIDAGSSGSRIYLYEWPHRADASLPLVTPSLIGQTVISQKINIPLSGFASDPTNAGESLTDLIDYIKKSFDSSHYSRTPIYLKATAGMRAISQQAQDQIISDVRSFLHSTPFLFKDDYAQVIPGTQEGVYGWITVNYLLQILTQADPSTFGALDMGGASTQITFKPATSPAQFEFPITLASKNYPLYTYSYPLGQDQSLRELAAGLNADNLVDSEGNVLNPCYLVGYNETNTVFNKKVVGTGIYDQCRTAVLKYIVKPNATCTSCGMASVYQPAVTGKFYAFSAFAYTFQFYGLTNTSTVDDLLAVGKPFCASTFADAKSGHPAETVNFLKNYCFTATYYSEVLQQYGFPTNSKDVVVQASVGTTEVTWALGGMIYEANLLPFDLPNDSSAATVFVSFFGMLLVLFVSMF